MGAPRDVFSTAGKREKLWGVEKAYHGERQRCDDLFFEFSRLLGQLRPWCFVAENVSGLVKGKAKGYFKMIMADLKRQGYRVRAQLLDAQWLGVPQVRRRVIFVGFRDDLCEVHGCAPAFPAPLAYRYSLREACPDIDTVMIGKPPETEAQRASTFPRGWVSASDRPCGTVVATGVDGACAEVLLAGHPLALEAERSGQRYYNRYTESKDHDMGAATKAMGRAYYDESLNLKEGQKSGKYFGLIRSRYNHPVGTITASSGASVIHPTESRKFTIAELKRICGFPDDFRLAGSFSKQWARLGLAVPPVMMRHISAALLPELDKVPR